jgi:feruloyl esterase
VAAAGALTNAGAPVGEHCVVTGKMNQRVSTVDGQTYAIGFEMRLPTAWNGRFFYQANGGLDGFITPAYGDILGGGQQSNGLLKGFAVISSDAGHAFDRSTPIGGATFGLDPQARRDYGYNAVAQLTPMAKALLASYYGKRPDTSYLVGSSNGGRHGFVAASRVPDEYDGILVSTPGYRLPLAAVAQVWDAQQFASIASRNAAGVPDLTTALPPAAMELVARSVLARCDALDGLADGIVSNVQACKTRFDIQRDVPTCAAGTRDGMCLSAPQKNALANVFKGARNSAGQPIYSSFPFDAGVSGGNWREWKFASPATRDAGAVAFIFSTPPLADRPQGLPFALGFDMDRDAPRIAATDGVFRESALSFMTPPDAANLGALRDKGGRMIVYHGTSDPVFSSDDTAAWYERVQAANGGDASSFARYFPVPGMNHCSGGPATDQFDMLSALVDWVEQGKAPASITASARGAGTPVPNAEVPASWSPQRTRPLCPYPQVATYTGGDTERASSFACKPPSP